MVIWSTHLTQRMPETPGTTMRKGNPLPGVKGWPFIYGVASHQHGRETRYAGLNYLVRKENIGVFTHRSLQGNGSAIIRILFARRDVGREACVKTLPRCAVVGNAREEEDVSQRGTAPADVGNGALGPFDTVHTFPRLLGHLGPTIPGALCPHRVVRRLKEGRGARVDIR